jgi:hypothetical protein
MTLFAGPYIGEFGWEVAQWAPLVRARSRAFDRTFVAAPDRNAYLYEDFADKFIGIEGVRGHAIWQGLSSPSKGTAARIAAAKASAGAVMDPRAEWRGIAAGPKEHRLLGDAVDSRFSVVCFFRPPKPLHKGRGSPLRKSYPEESAGELVNLLLASGLAVSCGGGPDNRMYGGADDLRGIDLGLLCGVLRGAKCAVGPSSGPLHLAAACGCPVVTWCDHANVEKRYRVAWNPWGVRVEYLRAKGNPPPEAVAEAVGRLCG